MKFAIITDQHFCVRDSSEFFSNNYRKFYKETFFPYFRTNGIKTILCLGDTFEDRRKLNINGLQAAREMYFDEAERRGIKIITILGNHDVYYRNTNKINSIDILCSAYKNIELIYDTEVVDFDGFKLALCSWINKENYKDCLEFIKTCDADYLAGHFEINGFEMTKGHVCETGMNQELFERFKEVWSGHFHIKSKNGNIEYLGNPSQTNKGDLNYLRGFHVFDTDTRTKEFIQNPFNVYESVDYRDTIDIVNYDFEQFKDKIIMVNIQSYLKVDTVKLNLFVDKLNEQAQSSEIIEWENNLNEASKENIQMEYTSNIEMINNYIKATFDEEDVNQLAEYMNELYNEALNVVEDE